MGGKEVSGGGEGGKGMGVMERRLTYLQRRDVSEMGGRG